MSALWYSSCSATHRDQRVAPAGYLFTYWHTKQADERKANIERINEQLRELYGPLLACVTATQSAYHAMIEGADITPAEGQSRHAAFRFALEHDPSGPEGVAYRCGLSADCTLMKSPGPGQPIAV
jgi:acyl-CoA reductase-like NAD-dependent aldehyde dehydrogenase